MSIEHGNPEIVTEGSDSAINFQEYGRKSKNDLLQLNEDQNDFFESKEELKLLAQAPSDFLQTKFSTDRYGDFYRGEGSAKNIYGPGQNSIRNIAMQCFDYEAMTPEEKNYFLKEFISTCHDYLSIWDNNDKSILPSRIYSQSFFGSYNDYEIMQFVDDAISLLGAENAGHPEELDFILDLLTKSKNSDYCRSIVQAIESIDINTGAGRLIEKIRSTHGDDQKKYLNILYRLEAGQVQISGEGLEYLGKKFELGEYNNPANFAERLTADGKVGVFDQGRALKGFIQLEATDFLDVDHKTIQKEFRAITKELLFYQKVDEKPEETEKRERILQEFCNKYFETFLGQFDENSGVRFNNLNLREQGWALLYLDGANPQKQQQFFDFANQFGEAGIRSLIAMDYGVEFGDRVIELGHQLKPAEAKAFFAEFSSIITRAENLGNQWKETLGDNSIINSDFLNTQITEAIIRKSKDFILAAEASANGEVQFKDLDLALKEFDFVLNELTDAIKQKGSSFEIAGQSLDAPSHATTWHMIQPGVGYKVNLTVRTQEGITSVKDKTTGGRREVSAQPCIRATFVWPSGQKFGLRLDLDSYYKDDEFQNGRLSLDIGSRESKIAQILDQISPEGGHHNIDSFSPELSQPQNFRFICESLNYLLASRQAKAA